MPTLNWVFENQPIVLGTLIQPSNRKQFASRRKRSLKRGAGSYLFIHLYYRFYKKKIIRGGEVLPLSRNP